MSKSILLSIQPEWVAKILNGEKTIEIRKKFPAGYRGWVYIYCTKNIGKHGENQLLNFFKGDEYFIGRDIDRYNPNDICYLGQNGKVVGRFWCDRVEEIYCENHYEPEIDLGVCVLPHTVTLSHTKLLEKSCLENDKMNSYLKIKNDKELEKLGYALHITYVKVFPEPKELRDYHKPHTLKDIFKVNNCPKKDKGQCNMGCSLKTGEWIGCAKFELTKAPQNYCYIDGDDINA